MSPTASGLYGPPMEEHDPGYDDWFDEPEPPTQEAGRGSRGGVYDGVDEVWVLPEDEERRRPRRSGSGDVVVGGVSLTTTQLAIIAAAVLAIFFGALAAAGVFNSNKPATQPITTVTPPPNETSTTVPTVTTPAVTAPTTTLKPGATGAQVKDLQRALNALGFSVGKPDGDYGPATQSAVEQFQSSKGLTADGIVGPATLNALQQALGGSG